jgi:hypothetical protein
MSTKNIKKPGGRREYMREREEPVGGSALTRDQHGRIDVSWKPSNGERGGHFCWGDIELIDIHYTSTVGYAYSMAGKRLRDVPGQKRYTECTLSFRQRERTGWGQPVDRRSCQKLTSWGTKE